MCVRACVRVCVRACVSLAQVWVPTPEHAATQAGSAAASTRRRDSFLRLLSWRPAASPDREQHRPVFGMGRWRLAGRGHVEVHNVMRDRRGPGRLLILYTELYLT